MSGNAFEGPIPTLPTDLVSLDISVNKLSGSLPADMSAYTNLVDIQAYYNDLEGSLPSKMPPHLVQLAVAGNKLSGAVPPLPRGIKYVSVAENQLEGGLPDGPGASSIWFVSITSFVDALACADIASIRGLGMYVVQQDVSNGHLAAMMLQLWHTVALDIGRSGASSS